MKTASHAWLFVAVTAFAAAGCSDPAKDAPKATVESARPIPPPSGAKSAGSAGASTGNAKPSDDVPAPDGALAISSQGSSIGFVGSKVTGKHEGKFEKFDGWMTIDGDKAESARIFVSIDMSSVKTDEAKLDGHLKGDDFFDIANHPKATFQTSEIKVGGEKGATHTITGNLKLRGVEKSVTFPATVKIDADSISATAEFAINRQDFNIKYAGKKDDLIRDDVLLKLELKVARKK